MKILLSILIALSISVQFGVQDYANMHVINALRPKATGISPVIHVKDALQDSRNTNYIAPDYGFIQGYNAVENLKRRLDIISENDITGTYREAIINTLDRILNNPVLSADEKVKIGRLTAEMGQYRIYGFDTVIDTAIEGPNDFALSLLMPDSKEFFLATDIISRIIRQEMKSGSNDSKINEFLVYPFLKHAFGHERAMIILQNIFTFNYPKKDKMKNPKTAHLYTGILGQFIRDAVNWEVTSITQAMPGELDDALIVHNEAWKGNEHLILTRQQLSNLISKGVVYLLKVRGIQKPVRGVLLTYPFNTRGNLETVKEYPMWENMMNARLQDESPDTLILWAIGSKKSDVTRDINLGQIFVDKIKNEFKDIENILTFSPVPGFGRFLEGLKILGVSEAIIEKYGIFLYLVSAESKGFRPYIRFVEGNGFVPPEEFMWTSKMRMLDQVQNFHFSKNHAAIAKILPFKGHYTRPDSAYTIMYRYRGYVNEAIDDFSEAFGNITLRKSLSLVDLEARLSNLIIINNISMKTDHGQIQCVLDTFGVRPDSDLNINIGPSKNEYSSRPELREYLYIEPNHILVPAQMFGTITVNLIDVSGKPAILIEEVQPSAGFRRLVKRDSANIRKYGSWHKTLIDHLIQVAHSMGIEDFYASTPERAENKIGPGKASAEQLKHNYHDPFSSDWKVEKKPRPYSLKGVMVKEESPLWYRHIPQISKTSSSGRLDTKDIEDRNELYKIPHTPYTRLLGILHILLSQPDKYANIEEIATMTGVSIASISRLASNQALVREALSCLQENSASNDDARGIFSRDDIKNRVIKAYRLRIMKETNKYAADSVIAGYIVKNIESIEQLFSSMEEDAHLELYGDKIGALDSLSYLRDLILVIAKKMSTQKEDAKFAYKRLQRLADRITEYINDESFDSLYGYDDQDQGSYAGQDKGQAYDVNMDLISRLYAILDKSSSAGSNTDTVTNRSDEAYSITDPRDEAMLHYYRERQSDPESHSRYLERVKMYEALLKQGQDEQKFLEMFDSSHPRSLIFKTENRGGVFYERGILHKKDIIMVALICSAMLADQASDPGILIETIDLSVLNQTKGTPVSFTSHDIAVIRHFLKNTDLNKRVPKPGGNQKAATTLSAAFKRLENYRVYLNETYLENIVKWAAKKLYSEQASANRVSDLVSFNRVSHFISQAA
jgi:hypothetical protein